MPFLQFPTFRIPQIGDWGLGTKSSAATNTHSEGGGATDAGQAGVTHNGEKIILAATYVPAQDEDFVENNEKSGDFEGKVNMILGDEAESSKSKRNL